MYAFRDLTEEEMSWFKSFGLCEVNDVCEVNGQQVICVEKWYGKSLIELQFALSKKGYQYYFAIDYSVDGSEMFGGKLWTIQEITQEVSKEENENI